MIHKNSDDQRVRRTVWGLRKERQQLETYLLNTGNQMAVWLSYRYTYCRKGGCKCTKGRPHGPFYYLSFKGKEGISYRYLPADKVKGVKPLAESYKNYGKRLARVNQINKEIDIILRQYQKDRLVPLPLWLKTKKIRKRS